MAAPEMHYFTRVTEHGAGTSRTAPAQRNGVPVRITAADGTFSLGMPSSVRTAAGAGGAAPADATGPAPTQRGGLVVLMHPAEQARYSSARLTLVGWLAADAVAVAVMLWETADRLQSGRLVTACVLGLLGWALGLAAAAVAPRALGVYAVVATIQFALSVPLVECSSQLVHTLLQPLLAQAALALRRSLLPSWFSNGRMRQNAARAG